MAYLATELQLKPPPHEQVAAFAQLVREADQLNTTIAVVATDAAFDKVQMQKVAQMAQNGLARVLRPAHTMFDGDTVFALSVSEEHHPKRADVNVVGEVAAEAVVEAVLRAVKQQ